MDLSTVDYEGSSRPRYGMANPERIENPLWEHIIRNGLGGYGVRKQFCDPRRPCPRSNSTSAYREQENGPVWCWDRLGRTSTALPDGRIVHVAGEHEDFYDPDFCIFNDVVVEHPDGQLEIYAYPKEVFPPTDFHTATLVGDKIILIGSIGYRDLRRFGTCQVFRLDTSTWRMEKVETTGEGPGWIAHHEVAYDGGNSILVYGGRLQRLTAGNGEEQGIESVTNPRLMELQLDSFTWQTVPFGDRRYFDVALEDYRTGRNPSYGTANPERIDNPFWHEMVRSNWTPARARQHFGDPPEPCPNDSESVHAQRPIEAVVWSAARDNAAVVDLDDGRRLTIGGEFSDFGLEWADRWVYNDIIVRHPDGAAETYAYPVEALPPMTGIWGCVKGGRILVFGNVSRYQPGPRRAAAVAIDPDTLQATLCDTIQTRPAVLTYIGPRRADDNEFVFAIVKRTREDPLRYVSFDLKALTWRRAPSQLPETS